MNLKRGLTACAFMACIAGTSVAHADAISGLFNTGLDASGNVLADNGDADAHYTVDGAGTPIVYYNSAYVKPADANYIALDANGDDGSGGGGVNTYTLDFSLGALSPLTATLNGSFAADDIGDAYLNGHFLGTTGLDTFSGSTPFSATSSDFVGGANVLSFVISDNLQPSAFVVSGLSGSAQEIGPVSAAPEPSAWLLMIAGIGGIGLMLRRAKKTMGFPFKDAFSA